MTHTQGGARGSPKPLVPPGTVTEGCPVPHTFRATRPHGGTEGSQVARWKRDTGCADPTQGWTVSPKAFSRASSTGWRVALGPEPSSQGRSDALSPTPPHREPRGGSVTVGKRTGVERTFTRSFVRPLHGSCRPVPFRRAEDLVLDRNKFIPHTPSLDVCLRRVNRPESVWAYVYDGRRTLGINESLKSRP